jgi:hypothetical protein
MAGSGAISAVIRFACHLPLGVYQSLALAHWKFVKKNTGILLEPPFSGKILMGEQFAGPGVYSIAHIISGTY